MKSVKRMKVFGTDILEAAGLQILSEFGDFTPASSNKMENQVAESVAMGAEAIIVRGTRLFDETVEALDGSLKIVVRSAVGVDTINVDLCTQKGILVCNCPTSNNNAVSEHVVLMMLALSKKLVHIANAYKVGNFSDKNKSLSKLKNEYGFIGNEISNKTLGILGYGKIGRLTADKCRNGFGMKIAVYDPYLYNKIELPENTFWCETLDEAMKVSDYISLNLPLTPETQGMITERELRMMKPTAFIINCARGGIIVEEALYNVCKEQAIAGAGVDVLMTEPPQKNHPFFELENMIVTPHSATTTQEAMRAMAVDAVRNLRQYYDGQAPFGWVNKKQLADRYPNLK